MVASHEGHNSSHRIVEAPLQPVATATKGGGMISLAIIDPNTKKPA
jgi:hypothetical protein